MSVTPHGITQGDPAAETSFPRQARLTTPADFKHVFNKPTVSADRLFKVLARAGKCNSSRLGMAVSRQVDKRSVGRNRIKRVIRESFRQYFAADRAVPAVDFVVLPRSECATICNRQLRDSLARHWARILVRLGETPNQP